MSNRRPLFIKDSNPNAPGIYNKGAKIYFWDGTSPTPEEIELGNYAMPPQEIPNEFFVWSDTHTLGYNLEQASSPIFFSDGGQGDAKTLEIINHIARRLGEPEHYQVEFAKAWIFNRPDIYVAIDDVVLPQTNLAIHYDTAVEAGYDEANKVIKNLALVPNAQVADMQVLGGNPTIDGSGFIGFDGVSTYAEAIGTNSELWSLMDFNGDKSFTLYGAFYANGEQSSAISFGKFGGYSLFEKRSYDPNFKFAISDIWDDGDTDDFINFFPTSDNLGVGQGSWFQAGLRVTYLDDGSDLSKVELLFNGKSLQTWLDEYDGPLSPDGAPAESGPARFAYFQGTEKIANFQWSVEPTSWKTGPFRMGRHSYDNFYGANKVSYFAHYTRSINDEELLALHNYHQTRFE